MAIAKVGDFVTYAQTEQGLGRIVKIWGKGMQVAWLGSLGQISHRWHGPRSIRKMSLVENPERETYAYWAGRDAHERGQNRGDLCMNLAVLVGMMVIIWLIRGY